MNPGRRGGVLLVFAVMYAAFGAQVWADDPARAQRLAYLYALAPAQVWAVLWWLVAAVALSQAWMRRDALAFAALEGVAALWAGAQLLALLLAGDISAGAFGLLFAAITVLLRVIDGWVELPAGYVPETR